MGTSDYASKTLLIVLHVLYETVRMYAHNSFLEDFFCGRRCAEIGIGKGIGLYE